MRRAAVFSLGLRFAAAGMTYVFAIVMARIMTIGDFGLVSSLMSAAQVISAVTSVGQCVALVRFIPPLVFERRNAEAQSMMQHAFRLVVASNAAMLVLLVGGALFAGRLGWLDRAPTIAFGLLLVPLIGFMDHLGFLGRAMNILALALVPKDIVWRLVSVAIMVGLFMASGMHDLAADDALTVLCAVLLLLILVSSLLLSRWAEVPSLAGMLKKPQFPSAEAWRKSLGHLSVVNVSQFVYANLDVVVAAVVLGTANAALYFAANRLALVLSLFEQSVSIVASPIIANELFQGNRIALDDLAAKASSQVFWPSMATGSLMIALAVPLLRLFGGEFEAAKPVLLILLCGRLLLTLFGPSETFLIMSHHEKLAMKLSVIGIVVGFGVAIVVGYLWGLIGIASGIMGGALLRRVLFTIACRTRLGLRTDIFFATARQLGARAL